MIFSLSRNALPKNKLSPLFLNSLCPFVLKVRSVLLRPDGLVLWWDVYTRNSKLKTLASGMYRFL